MSKNALTVEYYGQVEAHLDTIRSLAIWASRPEISILAGGKTGRNYLVRDARGTYVARFSPLNNDILGIDRARVEHNASIAGRGGVGPRVIASYPGHDLLIVEYIDGEILSTKHARERHAIERAANLFKKLHDLEGFQGYYDPLLDAESYVQKARGLHAWVPEHIDAHIVRMRRRLDELRPIAPAACHFDPNLKNIIVDKKGDLTLIDWEYAQNGDKRFDIAMYSTNAQFDSEQENAFLAAYGADIHSEELHVMKALVSLSLASYGILQNATSERTSEFNYKEHAESELKIFSSLIGS